MSNIIDSIRLSGVTYTLSAETSGGNNVVELTQAQYDVLDPKDPTAFYIITDAQPLDISEYWTSAQTQSAITEATSGKVDTSTYNTYTAATDTALASKQDTLVSGTNIKTINNESILGSGNIDIQGGGKAIEAGRGISVTTGETADTVSISLPIYSGSNNGITIGYSGVYIAPSSTGQAAVAQGCKTTASGGFSHSEGRETYAQGANSHSEGQNTYAIGEISHSEGYRSIARKVGSHAEGNNVITNNSFEHSQGQYNISSSASTTFGDSGNTLFSVGNGTADNARHNAFEIRQNGDIYITSGGTDIKLQDNLGGGGGIDSGTVQTMIDNSLSGYVYTADNGKQDIYGSKTFIGEKRISFTQGTSTNKPGFTIYGVRDAEGNASQLGTFELNPTAITESNTTFPLLSLGHYRSGNRRASVQSYIGFRQYDYDNSAAYHLLAPLPQNAKTPFSLTTNFQNFYMPLGIKVDNSTMVKADSGGVIDISSYIGSITIDPSLDSGSTNAVANSAITNALNAKSDKGNFNNFMFTSMNGNPGALFKKDNGDSKTLWFSKINGTKVFEISSIEQAPNFSLVETSAITTSVTSSSTDSQVPSAKAVYDIVGNIETLLSQI